MPSATIFLDEERNKKVRIFMAYKNLHTKVAAIETILDEIELDFSKDNTEISTDNSISTGVKRNGAL